MKSGLHLGSTAVAALALVLAPLAAHAEEPPADPPVVSPPIVILPPPPSTPAPPVVPTIPEGDFSLGPHDLGGATPATDPQVTVVPEGYVIPSGPAILPGRGSAAPMSEEAALPAAGPLLRGKSTPAKVRALG